MTSERERDVACHGELVVRVVERMMRFRSESGERLPSSDAAGPGADASPARPDVSEALISFRRDWIKHVIDVLSDPLPPGRIGDAVFLLRGQLQDALDAPPQPAAGEREEMRPKAFLAWAVEMFGPVAKLRSERLMRFIEEAIELAHADEMERHTLEAIANRVYARPKGTINKEIGQAQACLETYAENIGESSDLLAEHEWQRVQRIPRSEWERRHTAKQAIGIAEPSLMPARETGR